MHRKQCRVVTSLTLVSLAAIAACSSDGEPGEAIVTVPVRHVETNLAVASDDLAAAGPAYVESMNDALDLGLSAADEYRVVSVVSGRDGLRHARMQQVHAGVPVQGAEIVVHADESTFISFNGYVTKHLGEFDVAPAIAEAAALSAAKTARSPDVQLSYGRELTGLVIMPRQEGGATLAWRVELFNLPQSGVEVGRWIYYVDARTGAIARSYNALTTEEQASGPGGNPKQPRSWAGQLDVEPMDGQFAMETARLETYDMEEGIELPPMTVRGPLDPIGDAAINDAHGYAEVTLNMMRDWYGHNSIDDAGFVIRSRVHYDVAYENAFWDGEQMTYGDGADKFYPLSGALDVVAHEINHGFTEFHSNLVYDGMSGGLNESFSDIAGALAEFNLDGAGADMQVGEDIFIADGALRYMCDPRADREYYKEEYNLEMGSIDHASDFERDIDVHFSSGVPNKAFCLAIGRFRATSTGGSALDAARKVGAAWYLANASYWTADTDYIAGCQGTVDAARALGFSSEEVAALADSWADVGVECEGQTTSCDDDGECEIDAGETCASCSADCDSCSEECGWFKKLKCKVGIGDCSRCDAPAGCGDGICGEDETDENCGRDCGCAADSCDSVAPYGCWCDEVCNGDCCADVEEAC